MHITFCGILFALCTLAAYYLIRSLVWTLPLKWGWRLVLAFLILPICYSFPIEHLYGDALGIPALQTLMLSGGSLVSLLCVFCFARDVLLLPVLLRKGPIQKWQTRLAPVVVLLSLVGCVWGYHSAYDSKVVEVDIPLPSSCAGLEGLRIVQISDTHVTKLTPQSWLRDIVAQTNALKPDIICLTGDMSDLQLYEAEEYLAPLKELRATYGVYFVDGNHEYFTQQIAQWRLYVQDMGFILLNNSSECIDVAGQTVQVAGVPDSLAEKFTRFAPDVAKAVATEESPALRILLAHRPQAVHDAVLEGVHLQLSGHTHAGQFFPWNIIVALAQPHFKGLYQVGGTQLYVNQGTGFWAIPNRLGTCSEITLFKLIPQP